MFPFIKCYNPVLDDRIKAENVGSSTDHIFLIKYACQEGSTLDA